MFNVDAFRMCNILEFTQNSIALIPYLFNYSQQFFVFIMDENLTPWNYGTEESNKHRVAKTITTFP